MELELSVGKLTDVGATRDHNEDCFIVHEPVYPQEWSVKGRLYAVADGMGGHAAGEVASRYVVDRLVQLYFSSAYEGDLRWRLAECVRQISRELHQQMAEKKGRAKMGTTLVCAVVRGDMLYVANVGDSRAYLIRGGTIRPLTRDHSLVAEFIEAGTLAPEDADKHPQRSVLTRALGSQPEIAADIFEERLQGKDTIVLCSDGLWGEVSDEEIRVTATQSDPQPAVRQLVDSANRHGGADNITAIVIRIGEPAAPTLRVAPVAAVQRPKRPIGLIVAALGLVVLLVLLGLGALVFIRMRLLAPPVVSELASPSTTLEATMPVVAPAEQTPTPSPGVTPLATDTPTISGEPPRSPTEALTREIVTPATAAPVPSSQMTITPPPIRTIVPAETPQVAVLPTFTTIPISTALPTPMATATPSLTPLLLLPTPTSTPTPVMLAYQAPYLYSPPNGAMFEGGPAAELQLEWAPVGGLATDEHYEVTVRYLEGGQEQSWRRETRNTSIRLPWIVGHGRADNDLFYWSVIVRRKSSEPGQEHPAVSPPSEEREFIWHLIWPTPTATRPPTLTPASTPKLTIPTATARPTLTPTVESTSTFTITVPVLLEPEENFKTDGSSVILKWGWPGRLDEGEYFDVQIRHKDQRDSVFVDWTREPTYKLKKWTGWRPGEYTWTIAIIRGHYDSGGARVFEKDLGLTSEARPFRWDEGAPEEEKGGGDEEPPHPESHP